MVMLNEHAKHARLCNVHTDGEIKGPEGATAGLSSSALLRKLALTAGQASSGTLWATRQPCGYRVLVRWPIPAACLMSTCLILATISAYAQDDLESLEEGAFRAAVDRVAPSVVRIETIGGSSRVGKLEFGAGPTTGLVVSPDGHVLTSAFNFLNRPSSILVQLADGTRGAARLVATDHSRMIVLLKINAGRILPVPQFAPRDEVRVGQWSIAVGRAFDSERPGVAVGIVSALDRVWGKAIQTDAAISPNNYGGPLVDIRGRVLGLLVPLSPQSKSQTAGLEWYDSGIGFAVNGKDLPEIVARLKKGEDLRPGVLGISFANPNVPTAEPVILASRPNSPAREAGLKADDRIVEIDGREIVRAADVMRELSRRYAGDRIRLAVSRGDARIECEATLVAHLEPYEHPFLGVLPMRTKADKSTEARAGVAVRYVFAGSPAAKAGIVAGDRILKLNGRPVENRTQIDRAICAFKPGEEVELEIARGEEVSTKSVTLGSLPEDVVSGPLPEAVAGRPQEGMADAPAGASEIRLPEFQNRAVVYVPESYHSSVPHGVVIWLHASGELDREELIARWKPHLDRHDLILLAPLASDADGWRPTELEFVVKSVERIRSIYAVDRSRTVACGVQGGGAMAFLAAFRNRKLIGGVATVDAPMPGRPPQSEPVERLAFYLGKIKDGRYADRVTAAVTQLREMKYPVTTQDLDSGTPGLSAEELTKLVRWIDTLDRI
jgi:serine protease Do